MEEIKQGYKQTDIGIIPVDWDVKNVNEAFRFLSNATFSRAELNTEDKTQYIHYGDIHTKYNEFIDFDIVSLPKVSDKQALKYPLVQEGDIIMADASEDYVGLCKSVEAKNINNKKVIAGLHTILMREKANCYMNGFKGYLFLTPEVRKQLIGLATGMKVYGVSKSNLPQVLLPVPTQTEQTAIATALSDTDALITALNKKIAKKQQIKQGAMQQLLTGKKRLPGFSGEWVEKKLGDYTEIYRGGSPRPIEKFLTTEVVGINWIKIGDVGVNAKYIESTKEKIIPEGIARSRYVKKGDFLLSNSMSFGRPYILKVNGCIHDGWLVIQNYEETFDVDFLYYLLGFETTLNQYKSLAAGSSVLNLNKQIVSSVIINCPLKSEQTAIAQILTDMDNEIAQLEKERDKYVQLKAGMMQVLLTGKVRLV